jgi:hypothetical protein
MEKEMNFLDLCMAIGRAIGRACKACGQLLAHMLRLSYRYWWVVLTMVVLALAAALYYTREGNVTHRVNAVAILNGPTLQQFEQAYAPLQLDKSIPDGAAIKPFVEERTAKLFETYHVIDCLDDGVADKIDFKRKIQATDTVNVVMLDRICLQFRIKERDFKYIPQIEQAMLDFLNSNDAMQQSYATYLRNLQEVVAFNHSQAQKLDSLTSAYYFNTPTQAQPMAYSGSRGKQAWAMTAPAIARLDRPIVRWRSLAVPARLADTMRAYTAVSRYMPICSTSVK